MTISPIVENYKRKDSHQTESNFKKRVQVDHVDKANRSPCCTPWCTKRFIPWGSMIALLITWTGLFLFCWKIYYGLHDMEAITDGLFRTAAHYFRMGREIIVILGFVMAITTGSMLIIGFFTTIHTERSYRGGCSTCVCSILASRLICGLFWTFGYLLNVCWLAILCLLVLMTSAYFCFLPICLPQAGTVDKLCFNFSMIASAITGGGADPNMVSLLLCGGPIDKFCKLTKAIVPWYWGAWGGCLVVIIGLSHFNGALAANFAHAKHARRYRRIRQRTKHRIRWTRDWRIKAVFINDPTETSRLPTVSETVGRRDTNINHKVIQVASHRRGDTASTSTRDNDSSTTGYEAEPYFDVDERRRLTQNVPRPRTTSTGSIVLQKRPSTSDSFTRNATVPCQASHFMNATFSHEP